MPQRLRTFIALCTVLCVLASMNALAPLLQCFAWGGMLVKRSVKMTWGEAVRTTFDGEHPCEFCKAIAAARDAGQGKLTQATPVHPDIKFFTPSARPSVVPPRLLSAAPSVTHRGEQRREPPLLRPPRLHSLT